jgi:hypothetical protein
MAKIFSLTDDIKQIAEFAIDDLIDQLGKTCKLVYAASPSPCPNCIFDPIGNKSSNTWISGGPIPFENGSTCPHCDGTGLHFTTVTKDIKVLVANSPKDFFQKMPANIQIPAGTIQTKGYMKDLPDVLQTRKMIFQLDVQGLVKYTYELSGEPIDQGNIVQGKYWVANWVRVGA